jgi:hypothetical protein
MAKDLNDEIQQKCETIPGYINGYIAAIKEVRGIIQKTKDEPDFSELSVDSVLRHIEVEMANISFRRTCQTERNAKYIN